VATGANAAYDILLANKQQWLAAQFPWPVLRITRDVDFAATTRYVGPLPEALDQSSQSMSMLRLLYWYPPDGYGIETYLLNYEDSDNDFVADPIRRWQIIYVINQPVIEVWPIPESAQTLRYTGQKLLGALVADDDKAELDDLLIVLFAAAEILARRNRRDAGKARDCPGPLAISSKAPSLLGIMCLSSVAVARQTLPFGVTSTGGVGTPGGGVTAGRSCATSNPNAEALNAREPNQPALCYRKDGPGPWMSWDVEDMAGA
jgi:hypothetical protein